MIAAVPSSQGYQTAPHSKFTAASPTMHAYDLHQTARNVWRRHPVDGSPPNVSSFLGPAWDAEDGGSPLSRLGSRLPSLTSPNLAHQPRRAYSISTRHSLL